MTYSRSATGTGMPPQERFRTRPIGRAFKRCPVVEISRFVADSSRSYANSVVLKFLWFLILLTLPIKAPLPGLFKADCRVAMRPRRWCARPRQGNAKSRWKAVRARLERATGLCSVRTSKRLLDAIRRTGRAFSVSNRSKTAQKRRGLTSPHTRKHGRICS